MISSKVNTALTFATEKHLNQFRKNSGDPYIIHPICVSENVRKYKTSKNLEDLLSAALLHDTVEDCNVSLDVIENIFGNMVKNIVAELTSDKEEIEKIGKTQYLINKMLNMTSYALVIKLADRLDNVKDLHTCDEKFRNKYSKETNDILKALESGRNLSGTHKILIKEIKKFTNAE